VRLILQCAVCGTINSVGLTACGTCRATGLENLRLLFECLQCFKVGLTPTCEACSRLLALGPEPEAPREPIDPGELARRWGVGDEAGPADDAAVRRGPSG
jgi:hypothetical protein